MRSRALWLLPLGLLIGPEARADDYSGEWSAGPVRASWAVGDWGEACGPRPSGGAEGGGTFHVTQTGLELSLSGPRTYRTTQCWEQMPGLAAKTHSASTTQVQTTCKMPAGDPRQATVTTTWALRGNTIYFDETGQYQFVLSGSNCTASSRRTRILTRIQPVAPVATAPAASAPALPPPSPVPTAVAAPAPVPVSAAECRTVGPPTQLEVSPKTKLLKAGDSFTFRGVLRDAKGCRLATSPTFALKEPSSQVRLSKNGLLFALPEAPSGKVIVTVQSPGQSVEVVARVVTAEEYEALLQGGEFSEAGESRESALVTRTESAMGTAIEEEAPPRKLLPLLISAGIALVLGALFFLFWTGRGRGPVSVSSPSSGSLPPPSSAGKLCPICGKTYPPEATFCGEDGALLVRQN